MSCRCPSGLLETRLAGRRQYILLVNTFHSCQAIDDYMSMGDDDYKLLNSPQPLCVYDTGSNILVELQEVGEGWEVEGAKHEVSYESLQDVEQNLNNSLGGCL